MSLSSASILAWGKAGLVAILALLTPIHTLMAAVGFLILADFLTGIAAAHKRGEPITSKAMARTIYKCLAYQLAVISGFAMEALVPGGLPIAKLCAGAIGLVEFASLAENVKALTGVNLGAIIKKLRDDK